MQNKLTATITGTNANTWLLSQANFLVKIAEHKLWSGRDFVTAVAQLKSVDASLAQMNDPSLTESPRINWRLYFKSGGLYDNDQTLLS